MSTSTSTITLWQFCSSHSASANTIFNPIMIQNIVTLPNFMLLIRYHSLQNMDSYTILDWLCDNNLLYFSVMKHSDNTQKQKEP